MYRVVVEFLEEDGRRHNGCSKLAASICDSKMVPNVKLIINKSIARSMSGSSALVWCQDLYCTIFEVQSAKWPGHCYRGYLAGYTCSCGEWHTTRFPCTHVYLPCQYAMLEPTNYLDHFYTSWHYNMQYENCQGRLQLYILPPFEFQLLDHRNLRLYAAVTLPKGRPRK